MNSEIVRLSKISNLFYQKNKEEIKDIILFGSLMRGKSKPNDIDLLIIFKNKVNKDTEYTLKKLIAKSFANISLISKTENSLYDASFSAREAILFEGYSLIYRESLSSRYGFDSIGMFVYKTKKMSNADKTMFYYALNGRRGSAGIVDALKGIKISDNIIIFPLNQIESAREFLEQWKAEYTYIPTLLPSRLAKKHIIGKVI